MRIEMIVHSVSNDFSFSFDFLSTQGLDEKFVNKDWRKTNPDCLKPLF